MAKNFYALLGVTYEASPEEIKAAYRRRVREYHPDHYGDRQVRCHGNARYQY